MSQRAAVIASGRRPYIIFLALIKSEKEHHKFGFEIQDVYSPRGINEVRPITQ
jgi:hypothetical protein